MSTDLARWQFATTSIYHFLFVPVTIGLAFLVALLQTTWYRNDDPAFRRLTRFFGTLLLINVAVGVVTGLVQEFEFGMNWSNYSRLVGNVFGGPLAMEGLLAFFLESTFLGLWIFGWDRLSKRVHLTCIWLVAGASMLSAAFIMAANSWMQHPVGYVMNAQNQPQLNDIWALFTNPVFLWAYPHVVLASLVTGAIVMLAVSAWHLRRKNSVDGLPPDRRHLAGRAGPGGVREHVHRQRARRGRGQVPADEDRRRRGAVDHLSVALPVLAVPDRGRQQRRDPDPDLRDPRPAVHPGHQPRRRRGAGPQQPAGAVRAAVRPGQLHPQRLHPVLGHAGDGLPGRPDRCCSRCGGCGSSAARRWSKAKWFLLGRPLGRHRAVPHEHRRVAADRERPTTLDRPGPDEDLAGGVAVGDVHRHLDQPERLRAPVRRARGGRRLPDGPLRPQEPRSRARRGDGDGGSTPGTAATDESEDDRVPALIY